MSKEDKQTAQAATLDKGRLAHTWWKALQPAANGEKRPGGGNRAALARLRRCSTWVEAAAEPETIQLFRMLGGGDERKLRRVAVLAAVLAHIREDEHKKVASSIGPEKADDEKTAKFSRLRLRRLLTTAGDDAIMTAFRRLAALMGGRANVADLAWLILYWDNEKTRMRFAFDYWQAGAAAPGESQETNEAAAS